MKLRRAGFLLRASIAAWLVGGLAMSILTTTAADAAAARASSSLGPARKALLVLSDMPPGWRSAKSSDNNSAFPGAAQLAQCLGVPASVITNSPPTAYSPTFASPDHFESVNDNVSMYRSAKAARADWASLANPKTPSCLTQVLNGSAKSAFDTSFGTGSTVGSVLVSRAPATDFAPGSANFRLFMPITSQGVTLNFELTVVDFVKGREEQTVIFGSVENPFPNSLAQHLTTVALWRLWRST
jgi:hypothetical protein